MVMKTKPEVEFSTPHMLICDQCGSKILVAMSHPKILDGTWSVTNAIGTDRKSGKAVRYTGCPICGGSMLPECAVHLTHVAGSLTQAY